jgi:NADPH-ferrihemoprotein reductase
MESSSSSSSMKVSPLDLMSAIIKGKLDLSNVSSKSASEVATIVFENREIVMILTTSIAVLIGCVVVLIWRRSNGSRSRTLEPPKPLIVKEPELDVDDGKKKVTIFFGTQTGTAEGFSKVSMQTLFSFTLP